MSQPYDGTDAQTEETHPPQLRAERLASIGVLAGGIAHELNNLLGGILMAAQYAGAALDRSGGHEIAAKALTDIATDARHGSSMVADLLRFAHARTGPRAEHAIGPIIEEALALATKSAIESTAQVLFAPEATLGSATVDRIELRQAVSDVITSALSSGAGKVSVEAKRDPGDGCLRVSVHDDGGPLSGEQRKALLQSLHARESKRPDARFSLALVRSLVEGHGGSVDVASSPAEGTRVTIELPLLQKHG